MHEEIISRVNGLVADLSAQHERESRVQADRLKLVNSEWLERCGQVMVATQSEDIKLKLQEELMHRVNGLAADLAAQIEREHRMQEDRLKKVNAEWLDRCGKTTEETPQNHQHASMQEELLKLVNGHMADLAAESERQTRVQADKLKLMNAEWLDRCGKDVQESTKSDQHFAMQEELMHRVNGLVADLSAQQERSSREQQDRLLVVNAEFRKRCQSDVAASSSKIKDLKALAEAELVCNAANKAIVK